MKQLHIHPDKKIFLREDDKVLFEGSFDEAEAVLGKLPPLPEGVCEVMVDLDNEIITAFGKCGQIDNIKWRPKIASKIEKLAAAGAKKSAEEKEKRDAIQKEEERVAAEAEAEAKAHQKMLEEMEKRRPEIEAAQKRFDQLVDKVVEISSQKSGQDTIASLRADIQVLAECIVSLAGR